MGPIPKVSGKSKWARLEQWQLDAAFVSAYQEARKRYIAGQRDVEFPHGTWQMQPEAKLCLTALRVPQTRGYHTLDTA